MITDIFLDVDGVLNAVPTSTARQKASGWDNWHTDYILGYPITWSEDMVAALNELAARDDVRFHWLTTWEDNAKTDLVPVIGLNGENWTVLYSQDSMAYWWKLDSLMRYVEAAETERFVWVDDDHPYYAGAEAHVNENGHDWLKVVPQTHTALTRDQYDQIVAFVDRGAEGVLESNREHAILPESSQA